MNKKITALVLSVMLILSMFTYIGVSAQETLPENIAEDYTAGAIAGNYFNGFSNVYAVTYSNDGTELTLTTTGAMGDGLAGASQERGAYGASVGVTSKDFWVRGNTIVFGAKMKNNGGIPRVKFAVWQASYPALLPVEVPQITDGTAVANTEWENISYTMKIPQTGANDKNNVILGFGFAETPAGETEGDRSVKVDVASAYLGIEAVHDIKVSANSTSVMAGSASTVELTAEVLNQVGSKGTLAQNFTWYALNDERTEIVEGMTITEETEGTATLDIASTVPEGKYDIVAVSNDYSQLVRGVTIDILSYRNDYVAGEITGNYFTNFSNSYAATYSDNGSETTLTTTGPMNDGVAAVKQEHGAYGAGVSVTSKDFWEAGNTVVFGVKAKNNGGTPRVKFGVWQASNPALLPIEAPGIVDGTAVTGTDWQDIAFTMPIPSTGINGKNDIILAFGFTETPSGETEDDRSVILKNDSAYLGIEYAYDIRLTADSTTWIPGKTEEINIDCDIVNQVGVSGTLNQGVNWFVMNKERTHLIDGIEVIESGNGDGNVKVIVDTFTVPAGKYSIVAASQEYGEFIKGVEIEVAYSPVLSELNLTKSGNNFTAAAKLLNRDSAINSIKAMIVIVALDENNKAKDYKVKRITNTYDEFGTASEESTTLTVADGVHHVNAFLWETTDAENPGITDTTLKEFAPMVTLAK